MVAVDPVRRLIGEQRSRLVATLLSNLEPMLRPLGETEWQRTRKTVMDAVGVYHDVVLDAYKVTRDGDSLQNDDVLRLIREMHRATSRIESSLNGRSD